MGALVILQLPIDSIIGICDSECMGLFPY